MKIHPLTMTFLAEILNLINANVPLNMNQSAERMERTISTHVLLSAYLVLK